MSSAESLLSTLAQENIHQRLFESRTLIISSGVDAEVAEDILSKLLVCDAQSHEVIRLLLNSPGGEVNSGLAIYDMIRYIASPVLVLNAGLCASIATIINCAVDSSQRFALPNAKFLIHQPLVMGRIHGQASDLEIHADDILKTRDRLNGILADACGQNVKKVARDTLRDYWMDAAEAQKYGLISHIISSHAEFQLPSTGKSS